MIRALALAALIGMPAMSLARPHATRPVPLTVTVDGQPKAISPDLFGVFFIDLNHAADGGLYAERIENRSFAYEATEQRTWSNPTGWALVERGAAKGGTNVDDWLPVHANNPTCGVL